MLPGFSENIEDNLPDNQTYFPLALRQKIYVIKEQIALGLSGNVYQMTLFLQDIKNYFKYFAPTEANFLKFMESFDMDAISECAILVFIVAKDEEGKKEINLHHYGEWREYYHPVIQAGFITGSGANNFLEKLNIIGYNPEEGANPSGINLTLTSLFLADEVYTMESIMDSWGAGFEMIQFQDWKFRKLEDITFVIWDSKLNETLTDIDHFPFLIMHYTYYKDLLVIKAFKNGEFIRHIVLPLDVKKEDVNVNEIPKGMTFESELVLSTFVIEKADGGLYFSTLLNNPKEGHDEVKVEIDESGKMELMVSQEITDRILSDYKNNN